MEKVGLNITSKEFKQLSQSAKDAYNIAVVVDYFASNQPEIEEYYNLTPVIKLLRNSVDSLNAFFIEHGEELEVYEKPFKFLQNFQKLPTKMSNSHSFISNSLYINIKLQKK